MRMELVCLFAQPLPTVIYRDTHVKGYFVGSQARLAIPSSLFVQQTTARSAQSARCRSWAITFQETKFEKTHSPRPAPKVQAVPGVIKYYVLKLLAASANRIIEQFCGPHIWSTKSSAFPPQVV